MSISHDKSAISDALEYCLKLNQLKGRCKQKVKIKYFYGGNYQDFSLVVGTKKA